MIKGSATTTAPRTAKGTPSSLYAPEPRQQDTTRRKRRASAHGPDALATDQFTSNSGRENPVSQHGHRLPRFFAYFSGPIIWAGEIATVLLIVLTHSIDFVGIIVIANLVMIVVMMVFRTSLGLWQDSHPTSTLDILERRGPHHIGLHAR